MDATPHTAPTPSHTKPRTGARARHASPSRAHGGRSGHAKRAAGHATPRSARQDESPFSGIDVEVLAELPEVAARKARALVRERPVAALCGAFAGGFILGGGWRTRIGRMMLLAATRYVAVKALEQYRER
jgi:hypothetical protein